jgi:6-phosphogluconolactonase (cycloisomerase 2 family)
MRHAAAGLAALASLVAIPATASAKDVRAHNALFVQTNDVAGNAIVAFHRNADGTLRRDATYPTGGNGATADASPGDTLASQGGLAYSARHGLLVAVNAGSDTITTFTAQGDQLSNATTYPSGGDFPVSVAVRGDKLFVLNAGGAGSITGYHIVGSALEPIADSTRSLGLANGSPPNFLSSPGQVGFGPRGNQVIVTTKANTSIEVFNLGAGDVPAAAPVVTPWGPPIPFAFDYDASNNLILAEAGPSSGVSSLRVNKDGSLTGLDVHVADPHPAACWIVHARGFFYVSNTGDNTITAYTSSATGDIAPAVTADGVVATAGPGQIDLAVSRDQRYLYVQNGGAGTVSEYAVNDDGSLTLVTQATGLPAFDGTTGMEGLVAV